MPEFGQVQWGSSEWGAPPGGTSTSPSWAAWNLCQLNTFARIELADPTARWWTDTEINQYINDWQDLLNHHFEFVWGTATITNTSSTILLTAVATDIQRLDAIYFSPGGTDTSTKRLSPRSLIDLDIIQQDWRAVTTSTGNQPSVSYQYDSFSVSFWPPPPSAGTYVFEYPKLTTLGSCSATMVVPPWTRYSGISYVCYRAFGRAGVNQNLQKALRYKGQWERDIRRFRRTYDNFFPEKAEMLRPGRKYNIAILAPRRNNL